MQQLSGMDASFLYAETPRAHMAGGGVAIYDPSTAPGGRVTFKGILNHIEERLHEARVFRQRLVRVPLDLDHPYWIEDPDFDLEFHVRHIALPAPGDWRQLCIQVARLVSRPLDLDRPLWELYVIEGLDNVAGVPRGSFALVTKVHHAAIDGMSGMEMTSAIHDDEPISTPSVPEQAWRPGRVPTTSELLMRAGRQQRGPADARHPRVRPRRAPARTAAAPDPQPHGHAAAHDDPAHPLERTGDGAPRVRRRRVRARRSARRSRRRCRAPRSTTSC